MNDSGYIYVLINASMEGLIKVGKTTREPKERAEELSKATGIPTPFIVAYEMYVNDCTQAEAFVHTWLEQKGYRVSDNREFFNAPMTEAINGILEYKSNCTKCGVLDDQTGASKGDEFLDSLTIEDDLSPGEDIFQLAEAFYYGLGDTIQDYDEALDLYKKAAKLGLSKAYLKLGKMYMNGYGCTKDDSMALKLFKEAVRRGCNQGYAEMTIFFTQSGRNKENAYKCWHKYMMNLDPSDDDFGNYGNFYFLFVFWKVLEFKPELFGNIDIRSKSDERAILLRNIIFQTAEQRLDYFREQTKISTNDKEFIEQRKFVSFLKEILA